VVVATAGVARDALGEGGILRLLRGGALVAARDADDGLCAFEDRVGVHPLTHRRVTGEILHFPVHPFFDERAVASEVLTEGNVSPGDPHRVEAQSARAISDEGVEVGCRTHRVGA
jgi:hypothetical protein